MTFWGLVWDFPADLWNLQSGESRAGICVVVSAFLYCLCLFCSCLGVGNASRCLYNRQKVTRVDALEGHRCGVQEDVLDPESLSVTSQGKEFVTEEGLRHSLLYIIYVIYKFYAHEYT